ncbi:uncharacterized protein PFL1_05952 [Pseudozyma flocculosa PF-1]|uniref:Uncharacterized protein n=2 Tax=Pseudozyma flocculosa TaxID=84751 RepID=A0A5C3F1I4_9BASI|nr:uncharacterized protein PFL1_05952 [Pseudozyma flocculosa PF-1]EPQ26631.1 hypothetical protein PFL1_05952 [Pseudozyma flocculosa PF-1]SPO38373.1 uncharacterized protein PSFLO_03850 [Pseudozyma flocculosa]
MLLAPLSAIVRLLLPLSCLLPRAIAPDVPPVGEAAPATFEHDVQRYDWPDILKLAEAPSFDQHGAQPASFAGQASSSPSSPHAAEAFDHNSLPPADLSLQPLADPTSAPLRRSRQRIGTSHPAYRGSRALVHQYTLGHAALFAAVKEKLLERLKLAHILLPGAPIQALDDRVLSIQADPSMLDESLRKQLNNLLNYPRLRHTPTSLLSSFRWDGPPAYDVAFFRLNRSKTHSNSPHAKEFRTFRAIATPAVPDSSGRIYIGDFVVHRRWLNLYVPAQP